MLLVGFPALGSFPTSGDSQIPGPAQLPVGSPAPRISPAPGSPQIPKDVQLPVGFAAPKAFPAPKDPPNPWGFSAPCESPVPRGSSAPGKPQIPGHAQLPEGPSSPSTPQFPGGSPNPCGTLRESPAPGGDQAALLLLSLVFGISAVAVAIKSGKGTACPCLLLQGESSQCCPAPGGLGQDWGGVLGTSSAVMGKSRMHMCRVWPRQGPLPKSLWIQQWGGTGIALHWSSQWMPQEPPKPGITPAGNVGSISLPSPTRGCCKFPGGLWVPNP